MGKTKFYMALLISIIFGTAYADEGMWLLQLMKEQHLADQMKKQGLLLSEDDIYSPNQVSLKDAVGIFGGGCTGEIVSSEGLILTNHHCGFDAIQKHSSVEHDYLTNGFWAMNRGEELPTDGLTFTFIARIVDITAIVNDSIKAGKVSEADALGFDFLTRIANQEWKKSDLYKKKGIQVQALPFYAGNKYYLFYKKIYSDIRMVAAPPQSIGKFGGETDNWMWPRHTGDFSMFRVYADKNGEPADYNKNNVPLKCKKHLAISLKGIEDGDFAMVMGFPGRTYRFLTQSEVKLRMDDENTPRIRVREARQNVLWKEMIKSDKIRIQYASKYARSANYWKNAIGMNKAIIDNHVLEEKAAQEDRFAKFAKEKNNEAYEKVVPQIDAIIKEFAKDDYLMVATNETFNGIEFGSFFQTMDKIKKAIETKDKGGLEAAKKELLNDYEQIFNKDYDHQVDKKVAKALLPLFAEMSTERPAFYETIEQKYKGNYDAFIDDMYDNSIMSSKENLDNFLKKPTIKAIDNDMATLYSRTKVKFMQDVLKKGNASMDKLQLLHKTYVRGLCEMYAPTPKSPDANFTIRLTYGNVKSYDPKDGVHYNYYTTLRGVMEKEDPSNPEFVVPAKLKELYQKKDYGRYAMKNGELPVCFLTTNDITGGNSGSPVMNANGELIGAAFDGNWESLSGDINFENDKQRCIVVDARYVLFLIDKLGNCPHLIKEMTLAE